MQLPKNVHWMLAWDLMTGETLIIGETGSVMRIEPDEDVDAFALLKRLERDHVKSQQAQADFQRGFEALMEVE